VRAERSDAGHAAGRGYPSPRSAASATRGSAPRGRATGRDRHEQERQAPGGRAPGRRSPDPRTPHAGGRPSGEFRRPAPSADERRAGSSSAGRTAPSSGPRLRGAVAVLGIFLLTLVAAAADSYIGLGLGTITLVALTAGTVVAGLAVRRRDLVSVVVAPPLVFVAVALANIGLAPSASLNLPTLATLLVRGFPAMGIATAAAVLIALFRLVTRR
jgi:NADH:ubiquinone oxidoreductase subunit K